jgi:uncharacterized protein (TIGR02391 family)
MKPKALEKWRNELLTRLENLKIDARRVRQMMEATGQDELEDKSDFEAKWDRIVELFPEDFHPNRASDLARHIGFAMPHDFDDIEKFDVPAVMDSVRRYGRKGAAFIEEEIERVQVGSDVSELLHPQIKDACADLLAKRQFGEAAQRAVGLLMDELRRLSGQDLDGDKLIRKVVGTQPGKLSFSDCESNGSKQVTEGLKIIVQGLYKGVRNPIAHGWNEFRSTDVLQVMAICSMLLTNLQILGPADED